MIYHLLMDNEPDANQNDMITLYSPFMGFFSSQKSYIDYVGLRVPLKKERLRRDIKVERKQKKEDEQGRVKGKMR